MHKLGADTRITFHNLVYKRRLKDWIVGYEQAGKYLTVEESGLAIIHYLHRYTVGETEEHFPKHDVKEFIRMCMDKGLVYKVGHRTVNPHKHIADPVSVKVKNARWAHNPLTIGVLLGTFLLSIFLLLAHPSLVPKPGWFFMTGYVAVLLPLAFIIWWTISFLHEFGHYLAMRGTGHATGLSIVKNWHLLVPKANIEAARVLPAHLRMRVYLAGMSIDFFILAVSLIFYQLGIAHRFWGLVAFIAFYDILFQFTPTQHSDLVRVASHAVGVENVNTTFWNAIKKGCPFCDRGEMTKEEKRAFELWPAYLIGSLLLVGLVMLVVLPVLYELIVGASVGLVAAATALDLALFIDNLLALIMIGLFISFYFVAVIRQHSLALDNGFTWICIFLHVVANYTIIFLIAAALLIFTSPAFATVALFLLGVIFGMLFLRLLEHVHVEGSSFARDYLMPCVVASTALLLIVMLTWVAANTGALVPETIYAVAYAIGMLVATLF